MKLHDYVTERTKDLRALRAFMEDEYPELTDMEPGDWDEQFSAFVTLLADGHKQAREWRNWANDAEA